MKNRTRRGFTIIELTVVIVFAALLLVLFFIQKTNVDAMDRDEHRKVAINAMYYALEEGFYKEKNYYPETISEDNLKVIDPALFTDPEGVNVGNEASSYRYEPVGCSEGKCKGYTLRGILEREDIYIKQNRQH